MSKLNSSVVVDLLFNVTPIVGFCGCSMFCFTFLYVPSSFAIVLVRGGGGGGGLVAFLGVSLWCLLVVVRLILAVPWVSLQFVIVLFPDHTHYFCRRQCSVPACSGVDKESDTDRHETTTSYILY